MILYISYTSNIRLSEKREIDEKSSLDSGNTRTVVDVVRRNRGRHEFPINFHHLLRAARCLRHVRVVHGVAAPGRYWTLRLEGCGSLPASLTSSPHVMKLSGTPFVYDLGLSAFIA